MSRRLPQVISREETQKLLAACPDTFVGQRNRAAMILMYRAGLRVSEACDLTMDDVDLDAALVHVRHGKKDKERWVPLDPGACRELKRWLTVKRRRYPRSRWFLVTRDGKKTYSRIIELAMRSLSQKAGVYLRDGDEKKPVHPHVLRHNFATELLEEGFNVREVQQCLGHADLQTTMIYTEVRLPELRKKFAQRKGVLG